MLRAFKNFFVGNDGPNEPPEAFTASESVTPSFSMFSNHLNWAAWDEVNQLFHLDVPDGNKSNHVGVGFVIELNPKLGASDGDMALILSALQTLPSNTGMQFITYGCPNIDGFLDRYVDCQNQRPEGHLRDLFNELSNKRVDFWRKATTETIFSGFPVRLRDFRVILSIVLHDVVLGNQKSMDEAAAIREGVISSLKSASIFSRTWQPRDLKVWAGDMLNPARMLYGKDRGLNIEYDADLPLRDQIISPETFMRFLNDGKEVRFGFEESNDAVACRAYSIHQYPVRKPFHLDDMSKLLGHPKQINLNYTCPFVSVINIHKGDYDQERSMITMRSAEAQRRAGTPIAKYLPEMRERAEDMMMAQNSYTNGSGGLVHILHQVMLFDRPDAIQASENSAKSIWRDAGFEIMNDRYLQKQGLLAALPMSMDKDFVKGLKSFKRLSTKTLLNAVSMSPIMGEWRGVGQPILGLFGPNGQAMAFDFFSNPEGGNFNIAAMGVSGSGKSFVCNEIVRNYLGSGARAYVLDLGKSYKPMCDFVGGQNIEFSADSDIVINPFDNVIDIDEDRMILKLMLGTMVSPNNGINDYQESVLEQIILQLWHEKGVRATIDDVAHQLIHYKDDHGRLDTDINRMGTQLYPFTSLGVHGRWFKGKSNLNFNNDLVVLEMDELQSKPELQKVIIQFVLYNITQNMYGNLDRKKRSVVLIDEAWNLLDGGENEAKFINEGFRKVRKYNGAFITATQNAKDYSMSKAAMAALQNSDWIIALRGKEETVEELGSKLSLGEYDKGLIRNLRTVRGLYSEMFIHSPVGSGVGRLYSDPFNQLMASTNADDFSALRAKQNQGLTIGEALNQVLAERST